MQKMVVRFTECPKISQLILVDLKSNTNAMQDNEFLKNSSPKSHSRIWVPRSKVQLWIVRLVIVTISSKPSLFARLLNVSHSTDSGGTYFPACWDSWISSSILSQVTKNCSSLLLTTTLLDILSVKASQWTIHSRKNIVQRIRLAISTWRPKTLREISLRAYSVVN